MWNSRSCFCFKQEPGDQLPRCRHLCEHRADNTMAWRAWEEEHCLFQLKGRHGAKKYTMFYMFFQKTTSPDIQKCHNQWHWNVSIHMVHSHTYLSVRRCYTVGERLVPCGQFIYWSSLHAQLPLLHSPPAEGCLSDGGLRHVGLHSLLPWV